MNIASKPAISRSTAKNSPEPTRPSLIKRMESLDDELSDSLNYTGNARWMIPYADLLTVLMGSLLVLLSMAHMDKQSLAEYTDEIKNNLTQKEQVLDIKTQEMNQLSQKLEELQGTIQLSMVAPEINEDLLNEDAEKDTESELLVDTNLKKLPNAINITKEARGLVITMQDQVLFSPGEATLNADAKNTLDQIAAVIKEANAPIRVEGHTDNTPIATSEFPSNWELSTERATGIVRYFIQAHEFSPTQLSAAGYGEFKPVAANSSIQGKQKNRRVDIVVLSHQAQQQEPQQKEPQQSTKKQTLAQANQAVTDFQPFLKLI